MNNINKVKVTICGREYNLQTDDAPEYLMGLAARVDKEINDLLKAKPNFGIQNAAVFVALTSLDEANKSKGGIENIRDQISTYLTEAAKAREAKEKLNARIKELEAKVSELEKENKALKKAAPVSDDCEQLVLENTISPAVMIYAGDSTPSNEPKADDASSGRNAEKAAPSSSEQKAEEIEQTELLIPEGESSDSKEGANTDGRTESGTEAADDENTASADNVKKKKGRGRAKKN